MIDDQNVIDQKNTHIDMYSSEFCPHCATVKTILSPYIDGGYVNVICIDDNDIPDHLDITEVPSFVVNDTVCDFTVVDAGMNKGIKITGEGVNIELLVNLDDITN